MPDNMPATILHPRAFQRAQTPWADGVFDWSFLNGIFPRGITPMDIDAVVELNSCFLGFETKDIGVPVKVGQMLMLERLAQSGRWVVIILWGKTEPVQWQVMWKDYQSKIGPCNAKIVRDFCAMWASNPWCMR